MTATDLPAEEARAEYATLTLLDELGDVGDCLAEFEGVRINVFGGIPGERVRARIVRYRRRRKRKISAIVHEALEPSPHRVAAPCRYFGPCTGCQWQHIEYEHQLDLKRAELRRRMEEHPALRGLEVEPCVPSPDAFGYRNHARYTIRRGGSPGFVNRITRKFVEIDECMIMAPGINDLASRLQGRARESGQASIRYGVNTGDWLIQPKFRNPDIAIPTGQSHYSERMLGREFRIASPSFFQVNTAQAERMAALVGEMLRLAGGETVVDAYAGVGVFAILLAGSAGRVIAIEESAAAVRDARSNASANGVENLEFIEGRTEEALGALSPRPDAVILDPPRSGCHPDALAALIGMAPKRAVYVSCEPEALARDLAMLAEGGLIIESVRPIDLFPQTHHVETLASIAAP